jgi:ATP-dependent DNA helicase RecG
VRRQVLDSLAGGEPSIVIGTQALLEDPVRFDSLSVCVVDEEHRFGVRQRDRLDSKAPSGESAHLLHLSATPIPRTLSLTSYGDLDITSIRELPDGRQPVGTEVLGESERARAFERVRQEVDRGRQAFVVCPLVEESESIEARAAEAEADRLRQEELSGYEVGLIHGRMSAERKEIAMAAFERGKTDVLVATTVIEVGIDVPNATVIVIEGAERFGLSQLHQLRGRVGRGRHGGCCLLMTSSGSPAARRRLAALASESDGFRLAEIDLEMRGEGEVTGTRQHGLPRFRVARLPRDIDLLEAARADLDGLLARHGSLDWPGFGPVSQVASSRFDRRGAIR